MRTMWFRRRRSNNRQWVVPNRRYPGHRRSPVNNSRDFRRAERLPQAAMSSAEDSDEDGIGISSEPSRREVFSPEDSDLDDYSPEPVIRVRFRGTTTRFRRALRRRQETGNAVASGRATNRGEVNTFRGNGRHDNAQFWKSFKKRPFPKVNRYQENWGSYMLMRMLRGGHRNISDYVLHIAWKDERNKQEAHVHAVVLDDLIADFGIDLVKDMQSTQSLVRRIEALRVGDQTGNWRIASHDYHHLLKLSLRETE